MWESSARTRVVSQGHGRRGRRMASFDRLSHLSSKHSLTPFLSTEEDRSAHSRRDSTSRWACIRQLRVIYPYAPYVLFGKDARSAAGNSQGLTRTKFHLREERENPYFRSCVVSARNCPVFRLFIMAPVQYKRRRVVNLALVFSEAKRRSPSFATSSLTRHSLTLVFLSQCKAPRPVYVQQNA